MAEIVPNKVPCSKKPAPQPAPKPTPTPVVLCELSGVTYFKLRSDIPGDYTKNCGLLGDEIDKNFYFLRSTDIKTGYTVDENNRKYLVLERINCGKDVKIDITDEDSYNHNFRVEDGYIYVRYPGGEEDPIRDGNGQIGDGNPVRFLVEGEDVRIVTDASINGDGSYKNPIGLDLAYHTGTYAPADFFADLTCCGETINQFEDKIGHGHAIVTKENASRFGALYTYWQAKKLNEALEKEGRGWRLPTKEDWAMLLNWAEEEDKYRNHDTDRSGNLGCVAGSRLKSTVLWDGKTNRDDFGFSIYPVGICPENFNTREPEDYGFTGLYKTSIFWTSSEKDGEVYVRKFSYGHNDVYQGTESPACRFSIRLVRDIKEDFDIAESAEILGKYVPTILTTDGKQQWTDINIDLTEYEDYNPKEVTVPDAWKDINTNVSAVSYYVLCATTEGYDYFFINDWDVPSTATPVTVEEIPENPTADSDPYIKYEYMIHIDMVTEAKFYYNAWDGNRWHKKVMREGESVVLIGEDADTSCDTAATPYVTSANTNHEWRVFFNPQTGLDELIDTVEALKREFAKELNEINDKISGLTDDLASLSGTVADIAEDFESGLTSAFTAIEELREGLDEEISARTIADEELRGAIESLDVALSAETAERIAADEELWDALSAETAERIAADEELLEGLSAETSERIAADENLQEQIDELAAKTIEPGDDSIVIEVSGSTTTIKVLLSQDEEHLKLSDGTDVPKGLYIDMDFGEFED